jgi:hypothetical protein
VWFGLLGWVLSWWEPELLGLSFDVLGLGLLWWELAFDLLDLGPCLGLSSVLSTVIVKDLFVWVKLVRRCCSVVSFVLLWFVRSVMLSGLLLRCAVCVVVVAIVVCADWCAVVVCAGWCAVVVCAGWCAVVVCAGCRTVECSTNSGELGKKVQRIAVYKLFCLCGFVGGGLNADRYINIS